MDEKQEEEAAKQAEHFESIPWSSLVPDTSSRNRRIIVIGVTVVAGVLIGLFAGRILRGATQPGVVVTLPPATEPAAAPPVNTPASEPPAVREPSVPVATETPAPPTTGLASPVQAPVPPQLYSEADLMAVLPEEEMRAAVMRGEWFVTDYFTVDGETTAQGEIAAALPGEHDAAPLPHESPDNGISYVEWARAFRVEPLGPARYRITVAFRTLAGPVVGNLSRAPVRAVTVDVEVGVDGATAVLDFPSPAPQPAALTVTAPQIPEMEAPPEVAADALLAASTVGTDPGLLVAGLGDDGWRVVVLVGDESGLRWPLAVRP